MRAAWFAVVVSRLLACDNGPTDPVPAVRQVSLTPKTARVLLGRTVTLNANVIVEGGASNTVAWSSSNNSIASVSEAGTVTGMQPGEALVTATSTVDPTKKDAATVTVEVGEPASVAILSVNRGGTAFPVDPNAVAGSVDVSVNVSPGDQLLTSIDILVDDVVVASQVIQPTALFSGLLDTAPAAAPFVTVLSFNTGEFNAQTGVPRFLNVAHTLKARISTFGGGSQVAGLQFTFANQNSITASVATSGLQAFDAAGRLWVSGDLTVTVRPVIYSAGSLTLASAVIGFPGLQNRTAGTNGVVSWQRAIATIDGGSGGFSNNGSVIAASPFVVSSTLSDGSVGPSGALANALAVALRLDNRAPHPGVLSLTNQSATTQCCSSGWVGTGYLFANGHVPPPGDGEGVDGAGVAATGVTYHVGTPAMTNEQIVTLPAVTGSATLAQSAFFNAYTVVARVSDRVGNTALVRLSPSASNPVSVFGVDKVAPAFAFASGSIADGALNPAAFLIATAALDDVSGFADQPVLHRIIGNFNSSLCFLGGAGCSPVPGGFVITGSAVDGFYVTYEGFVRDQGGNASPTITRTALFDHQAPQIIAMPVPSLSPAPTLTQFSVSAVDNVDLRNAEHRLDFPGASGPLASLPFAQPNTISTFGAPLVTAQNNVIVSIPFVRSLEQTTIANVPTGTLQAAEGTRFRITDQAANSATQSALFSGGSVPAGSSATLRSVQTFRISAPVVPVALCSGGNCGAVPQTVQLSAEAAGPDGTFNNPFASVFFYWIDTSGLTRLIGSSTNPDVVNMGGVRRWTWNVNFSVPGAATQAGAQIFAIGVDGDGDGLRSRTLATVNIIDGS